MEAIKGVLDIITIGLLMYSVVLIIETIYTIIKGIKHCRNRK